MSSRRQGKGWASQWLDNEYTRTCEKAAWAGRRIELDAQVLPPPFFYSYLPIVLLPLTSSLHRPLIGERSSFILYVFWLVSRKPRWCLCNISLYLFLPPCICIGRPHGRPTCLYDSHILCESPLSCSWHSIAFWLSSYLVYIPDVFRSYNPVKISTTIFSLIL